MTSFVHIDHATQHPGVVRAENAARTVRHAARGLDGSRGAATLLLAAGVSALVVVANQLIDTWGEGHLLAAWMVLWLVAFTALALFAAPARRAGAALLHAGARWAEHRRRAQEDEKTWRLATRDLRVMADIAAAMDRPAVDDIRKYR